MKKDKKDTVLIVDDEAANLGVLFEHLRQAGFKVLTAEDGKSALRGASRALPDIALLDVNLPDIDGFELCRQLQELCPDIPVIFLTSLTDIHDKLRGLELNAVDYITKPFYSQEVTIRVKKHLMLRNLQKSLEEKNRQLELEIAERKRTEEALNKSQACLNETGRMAKVGGWEVDAETLELRWTEAVYRIHEMDLSFHPTVLSAVAFYAPDYKPVIQQALERAINFGEPFDLELGFITAKGNFRWVHAIGQANYVQGKITSVSGVFQDITDRRNMEEALRQNEARFRDMFENSFIAYQSLDETGRYIDMNQSLCDLLGYTREELLGKIFGEIWHEDTAHIFPVKFSGFKQEGFVQAELQLIRKDRSLITVLLAGKIQRDMNGKFIRTHCILHDITERQQMEKELRRAKEAAETANRAKSEFLANMSHEIRTPMNAVINMTRLLLDTRLDHEQRDFAETAMNSSEVLLSLVNDILDFSKIEAGKLELEHSDFNLADIVAGVVKILGPKAEEKQLNLTHSIGPNVHPYLTGDPARLRQIMINYVNNAVKFTHQGSIEIIVSVENETAAEITLKFAVTDTGIGIPQGQLNKLFQSFSQADTTTTRRYGGTGLGLAISKQLAELMGGKAGVESQKGLGSTFWFTAVFRKAQKADRLYQTSDEFYPTMEPCPQADFRILLAEDNVPNQKVALAMLKKFGFSADIANNGKEAVETLQKTAYHLVLMDMQMPEMDGIQAAQIIRQPDSGTLNPNVPIIAMTANATQKDRQKCSDAGMNDYISKPVNPAELFSVINKFLPAAAQPNESPDKPAPKTTSSRDHSEQSEIFNSQELFMRVGEKESFFQSILKDLPQYISEDMEQLKNALKQKDAEKILMHAHTIRGVCANASARRMSEAAHRIELISKQGCTEIDHFLTELEQEYQLFLAVLSEQFPELMK